MYVLSVDVELECLSSITGLFLVYIRKSVVVITEFHSQIIEVGFKHRL